jgi:hypothetical protein
MVVYRNGISAVNANFLVTGVAKPLSLAGKGTVSGCRLQAEKINSGSTNGKYFFMVVRFRN